MYICVSFGYYPIQWHVYSQVSCLCLCFVPRGHVLGIHRLTDICCQLHVPHRKQLPFSIFQIFRCGVNLISLSVARLWPNVPVSNTNTQLKNVVVHYFLAALHTYIYINTFATNLHFIGSRMCANLFWNSNSASNFVVLNIVLYYIIVLFYYHVSILLTLRCDEVRLDVFTLFASQWLLPPKGELG